MVINGRDVKFQNFSVDKSLLYVIKEVSKDTETQILSYFYDIGMKLFNDVATKSKLPQRCNRTVKVFYKDTDVFVKFDVYSSFFNKTRKYDYYSPNDNILIYMTLAYPRSAHVNISGQELENIITEKGLGLSDEEMSKADKPSQKKYRCMVEKGDRSSVSKPDVDMSALPKELFDKFVVKND